MSDFNEDKLPMGAKAQSRLYDAGWTEAKVKIFIIVCASYPVPINRIMEHASCSHGAITRFLRDCEKTGLVEVFTDKARLHVEPTVAGMGLYRAMCGGKGNSTEELIAAVKVLRDALTASGFELNRKEKAAAKVVDNWLLPDAEVPEYHTERKEAKK